VLLLHGTSRRISDTSCCGAKNAENGKRLTAWKTRHHTARVGNAGLENAGPLCRGEGGKRETEKRGNDEVWKAERNLTT